MAWWLSWLERRPVTAEVEGLTEEVRFVRKAERKRTQSRIEQRELSQKWYGWKIDLMCSFEGTSLRKGAWSSGMIGVSKTFGGSSILSTPVSV